MKIDQVRYFIMATLGLTASSVWYSNQPDDDNGTYDSCVTVFSETPQVNVHNSVMLARFQAIIRKAYTVEYATGETQAQTLAERVRSLHNRSIYNGCYLTAAMNNSNDPVSFDPDDGSGTSKASTFTANDYILIGSEILKVTGVVDDTVTASRAQLGTTIAAHSDNDEIHNITQNPIPGETCDSTRATNGQGVLDMGNDDKKRHEWAVNWEVTVKT